jgi:hypothetical protein
VNPKLRSAKDFGVTKNLYNAKNKQSNVSLFFYFYSYWEASNDVKRFDSEVNGSCFE